MVSERAAGNKLMIYIGSAVTAALLVALWFLQPAPPVVPGADAAAGVDATVGVSVAVDPPAADGTAAAGEVAAAVGAACPCPDGQLCLTDTAVPDGVCTRGCATSADCPAGWCCFDPLGAAMARDFVCAPPAVCKGRVTGAP